MYYELIFSSTVTHKTRVCVCVSACLFLWWDGRERINLLTANQWFTKIAIRVKWRATASEAIKFCGCVSKIIIVFWVTKGAVSSNYSDTCSRPSACKFHSVINGKQTTLSLFPFTHWAVLYKLFFSSRSCPMFKNITNEEGWHMMCVRLGPCTVMALWGAVGC